MDAILCELVSLNHGIKLKLVPGNGSGIWVASCRGGQEGISRRSVSDAS